MDDVKCRLCLFKTEQDESVNLFTPGKNNELISDTVMSFVPIELTRDDNLPQVICKVCVQKLNSIIEFRMIILNSDAQLKTQKVIVGRLKEALSAAIRRPQKLVQKSENQVCGDSASCESQEIKLDIHDIKLEIETEIKQEPDNTIKEQNVKGMHDKIHIRDLPFRCDICNKGFAAKWRMVYHRRIHLEERPFKCDECTKAFKFQASLRMHKRIHQGIRPYKCDLCDKTFRQSGHLNIHRRGHTGEKPHICEYCSKGFTTSHDLKRHHNVHTKGPYISCPTCGKSYANSSSLRIHMKIHNAVKRHTCDTCKKSFTLMAFLRRHMRTHSGKTHSCTLCDRKFAYRKMLLWHIKEDHSVLPLI
jgi:uncharacterized Zn-finger protein